MAALPTPAITSPPTLLLQRLNGDTSWLATHGGVQVAIDPWLVGEEVDGFSWFNAARLRLPAVAPAALSPLLTAIVLTQPFSDHCHEETLLALGGACPIFAVPGALSRLRRGPRALAARAQPLAALPTALPGWAVSHLPAPLLAPTHSAVLLASPGGSVLVAPHGLTGARALAAAAAATAATPRPLTLLATTSTFALPWWLGGTVNLGLQAAAALCTATAADAFHDTHSEDKAASGCAPALARRHYCSTAEVQAAIAAAQPAPWHGSLQGAPCTAPPPACARTAHYPPLPQVSALEGQREACATSQRLWGMAQGVRERFVASAAAGGGGEAAAAAPSSVVVHRSWCAEAGTHTYHTHVVVPGVCSGSGGGGGQPLLARVSELFFRAYELKQHGWYAQFVAGQTTATPEALQLQQEQEQQEQQEQQTACGTAACAWCSSCSSSSRGEESCTGWGVFNVGLGAPRAFHTLFTRRVLPGGQHVIVLRSCTPPPGSQPPLPGSVHVHLLPPTGDVFELVGGALHWHHICTVAGVRLLPGGLDGAFMTLLRCCGGDGAERGTYQREGQAFAAYVRALAAEAAGEGV